MKITDEEMQSIKTIQEEYTQVGVQLVQLKLALKSSEDYLKKLNEQEESLNNGISEINEREKKLADDLNEKYGVGSLDMNTGEFTPN
jgi:predicted  nucleic acid-binding Zn-ribbon protein|tara:strand:- start:2770 stop:3030 length:261 start_codon:yes stop_codon:yes gene_type:complete